MEKENRNYWCRWAELSGLLRTMATVPDDEKPLVMHDGELLEAADALAAAAAHAASN